MDSKLDLKTILDLHAKWLRGEVGGQKADLRYADLSSANLRFANLRYADLSSANLRFANLRFANLRYADLSSANLRSADLRSANLRFANLRYADLSSANLRSADLSYADLRSANLKDCTSADLALAIASHLPEGPFHAWKKCKNGVLVKLLIPEDAKRSHGAERKCRASKAVVLEVIGAEVGISLHDGKTEYRVGQTVLPDGWDEDRWNTCGQGIHFYITKLEAQAHF